MTSATFAVRPADRKARTSWIPPPTQPASEPPPAPGSAAPEPVPALAFRVPPHVPPSADGRPSQIPTALPPPIEAAAIAAALAGAAHAAEHAAAAEHVIEAPIDWQQSVADLAAQHAKVMRAAERDLVDLAAAIARRVIGRELTVPLDVIASMAREGIEALAARDRVIVRVSAGLGAAAAEELRARLAERAPGCEVRLDAELGEGGCVVETQHGRVDESIEERLSRVLAALAEPGSEER